MIDALIVRFAVESSESEGFAALGFDAQAFLVQLITFLLVFFVLKRYAFGPVVSTLEKRRKTIEEGLSLTSEMRAQREKLEGEIVEARKKVRKEADEIIASSHEQAGSVLKEAEEAAQRKIDAMLADAHKKIEEETERARRALEKDVVDLVVRATEAVAREKIDAKKDSELISRALRGKGVSSQ
jgi:F-type H+-transporting ATPase subunit b